MEAVRPPLLKETTEHTANAKAAAESKLMTVSQGLR
jgi:hypothetical protein